MQNLVGYRPSLPRSPVPPRLSSRRSPPASLAPPWWAPPSRRRVSPGEDRCEVAVIHPVIAIRRALLGGQQGMRRGVGWLAPIVLVGRPGRVDVKLQRFHRAGVLQ